MTEEIHSVRAAFQRLGAPVPIEKLADEMGVSVRTARRRISAAEARGLVEARSIAGTNYYTWKEPAEADADPGDSPPVPMTKAEEIADRVQRYGEQFDDRAVQKLKTEIREKNPEEFRKEFIDFVDDEIRKLELRKDDEARAKRERLKEDRDQVSSLTFIGQISPCPVLTLPRNSSITGTDARRDILEILWRLGLVPMQLRLMTTSASAVVAKFKNDSIEPTYDYLDAPRFPISAGESFVEELSTKYPNLDEGEKNVMSMILTSSTHFGFDTSVIEQFQPYVHFHEGRLLPPHMSYLDFWQPHRRDALWACWNNALNLKATAGRTGTMLSGVTRSTHNETAFFSKLIRMRLAKEGGYDYELPVPEMQSVETFLSEGEISWLTIARPLQAYLPDDAEEKRALRVLHDESLVARYKRYLQESEFCFVYVKHAAGAVARYDFFRSGQDHELLQTRDKVAAVASMTAVPAVAGARSLLMPAIYVPNVVAFAKDRAKTWNRTVKAQLYLYLRTRLLER